MGLIRCTADTHPWCLESREEKTNLMFLILKLTQGLQAHLTGQIGSHFAPGAGLNPAPSAGTF
jgi:hypothetical protein